MQQNKASILLFCGLPGSGKSTVARDVAHRYSKYGGNHADVEDESMVITQMDKVVIIDYDAIADKESSDSGVGISSDSQFTSNDLEAWRKSRVTALEILKKTLSLHFSSANNDDSTLLVIMDDNFHLRSMRREVYRTCQELLVTVPDAIISFSIAYISAPLDICLARNATREGKQHIPSHVITRMDATIEPPDESKPYASFEKFHITIDNSTQNEIGRNMYNAVEQCINASLQSPIRAKTEYSAEQIAQAEQERERQRVETLKCKSQRIDLLLRKLVGAVGRVDKKRSKEANETRKDIIERVKISNNVDRMTDGYIVQQFACKMLGVEASEDWQAMNTPLTSGIQNSLQEFQSQNRADEVS